MTSSEPVDTNPSFNQAWQVRLLPTLMRMIIGFTAFFFIVSLVQLTYLHNQIQNGPELDLTAVFNEVGEPAVTNDQVVSENWRFKVLAEIEVGTMQSRHHQTKVALMARVWTRYMGFVTGMILALLGALFVLAKLRTPESQVEGSAGDVKVSVKSTSPGIILAVLGVSLMLTTLVINHQIGFSESPMYVTPGQVKMQLPGQTSHPEVTPPDELFFPPPANAEEDEDG